MEQVERTGANVEEALEAALSELGLTEQEADVEVVQEPKGGVLGIGTKEAVVRVRPKGSGGQRPAGKASADFSEDELEDQAEVAAEFIEELLEKMDLDADVETNFEEDHNRMYIEIWAPEGGEEEMGLLIGHHGQVLEALQELTRIVVSQSTGERCMVTVDVEDYQKRRRSRLVSKARDAAKRVERSGKPERMEPMNPYDRKIVHDAVADIDGLESESEGEEPNRRVVITRVGR